VKEEEANLVHVELEKTLFSATTGERQSAPFVQMFNPKEWSKIKGSMAMLGYSYVKVLWNANEGTLC